MNASPHTSETPNPDAQARHAAQDKFMAENVKKPGNPFARQVGALRSALLQATSPDKVRRLMDQLFQWAMEGNIPAARLFLQYSVGKPAAPVEPDELAIHEWKIREEESIPPERFAKPMQGVPVATANVLANVQQMTTAYRMNEHLHQRPTEVSELEKAMQTPDHHQTAFSAVNHTISPAACAAPKTSSRGEQASSLPPRVA